MEILINNKKKAEKKVIQALSIITQILITTTQFKILAISTTIMRMLQLLTPLAALLVRRNSFSKSHWRVLKQPQTFKSSIQQWTEKFNKRALTLLDFQTIIRFLLCLIPQIILVIQQDYQCQYQLNSSNLHNSNNRYHLMKSLILINHNWIYSQCNLSNNSNNNNNNNNSSNNYNRITCQVVPIPINT